MPTYEYKCRNCDYIFEKFQSMNELPLDKCPKCGGKPERLLSGGGGFLFKNTVNISNDRHHEPCCSRDEPCDQPKKCCEN